MAENPPSEKELLRRLMDDKVPDKDLPPTPPMPEEGQKPKIIFADEDPKEFQRLMDEGAGKQSSSSPSASGSGSSEAEILRNIERLLIQLPREIASALGVD